MRRSNKRVSSLPGAAVIGVVIVIIVMAAVVIWAVPGW